MRILQIALLGATFLFSASGVASAADIYKGGSLKDEPVYVAPTIWAGFYAGIHAGAGFGGDLDIDGDDKKDRDDVDRDRGDRDDDDDDGGTSFGGGLHVGYNWQTSPDWVFGIEGSLSRLDNEFSDYLGTIRGRIGYAAGAGLFYGTAGAAFIGWSDDLEVEDDSTVGFVAGLGYEHKLSSNWSLGVEGLYYNFSTDAEIDGDRFDVDGDFWTVQARLSYHFTHRYEEPLK